MFETFEEYWEVHGVRLPGQPKIMELAFKEVAEKAWDAAVEAYSNFVE